MPPVKTLRLVWRASVNRQGKGTFAEQTKATLSYLHGMAHWEKRTPFREQGSVISKIVSNLRDWMHRVLFTCLSGLCAHPLSMNYCTVKSEIHFLPMYSRGSALPEYFCPGISSACRNLKKKKKSRKDWIYYSICIFHSTPTITIPCSWHLDDKWADKKYRNKNTRLSKVSYCLLQ